MDASRIRFGGTAVSNGTPEPQSLAADCDTALARDRDAALLLRPLELARFRREWRGLQARVADEPRETVASAHALMLELTGRLFAEFAEERATLERQWRTGEVSTEDLRVALTRYRSFFERLLM